jgi:hypothetical protein
VDGSRQDGENGRRAERGGGAREPAGASEDEERRGNRGGGAGAAERRFSPAGALDRPREEVGERRVRGVGPQRREQSRELLPGEDRLDRLVQPVGPEAPSGTAQERRRAEEEREPSDESRARSRTGRGVAAQRFRTSFAIVLSCMNDVPS